MSGGSLDYIQYRIDETAGAIVSRSHGRKDAVLLRAFAKHLTLLGEICHAIEWDFSGDSSLTQKDYEIIKAAIGGGAVLGQALAEARDAHARLGEIIDGVSL